MNKKVYIMICFLLLGISYKISAQKQIDFIISTCKSDCFIQSDIISQSLKHDTLNITIGVNLECCANFAGEFEYIQDTLNLIINNKPDKRGVIMSCECNCYYVANYAITNIKSLPEHILINGETFEQNRLSAGWALSDEKENNDTTEALNCVESFWGFLITLKRKNIIDRYLPTFKKNTRGMTYIDFISFENIMKSFNLSDSLIDARKSNYNECNQYLSSIKHEDFINPDSIAKSETINCNPENILFPNMNEYITNSDFKSKAIIQSDIAKVIVTFSNPDISYKSELIFILNKLNNKWVITDIKY